MSIKIGSGAIDKINNELIQRDLKRIKQSEEPTNFATDDKVEISSRALDLKEMQSQAMSASDLRTEKVDAIKLKIENGTYQISTEQIAERMLEEALE